MDNIKFEVNEPQTMVLKFDKPTEPQGQYDTQYWGTDKGNIRVTPKLLEKMEMLECKKGDTITIVKESTGDGKTAFKVTRDSGYATKDEAKPNTDTATRNDQSREPDWAFINDLKSYAIQKGECLKLAVLSCERSGFEPKEIVRRMDLLMGIITDSYNRILGHLNTVSTIDELNEMWRKYEKIWAHLLTKNEIAHITAHATELKDHFTSEA